MSNSTSAETEKAAPRRGRPPGSKNKPKAAVAAGSAPKARKTTDGASMMDALLAYMKAKPQAAFADARDAMAKAGHKLFPISWGRAQLLLGRVKRGAGRAAKTVATAIAPAPVAAANPDAPVKRGRGRPRKDQSVAAIAPTRVVARSAGGAVSIPVAASDVQTIQAFVDAANAGGRIELRYAGGGWSLFVGS